jgi:hypothetical protein
VGRRPHHTKRDANHGDVVDGIRAGGLNVWDIADMPGLLDLIVAGYNVRKADYEQIMVEVKPCPGAPFTEAELHILEENPHTTMVAYCAEDVLKRFGRV